MAMPADMIDEILVWLDVKTLLRLKCVCKHWRGVIESRRFVDRHYCHVSNVDRLFFDRRISSFRHEPEEANGDRLNLPYFVHDPRRMGPVNGVFCEVSSFGAIVLLNPATRKVRRLPSLPPQPQPRRWYDLRFGFGFDPSTGDYKTVAFYGAEFACVCTSSSEFWRLIEGVGSSLLSSLESLLVKAPWYELVGGFSNGVYYWVKEGILAFDMVTERFREIQPPTPTGVDFDFGGVGAYGESTLLFSSRTCPWTDIWVMQGKEGCWSKIFSFPITMCPCIRGSSSRWLPLCMWKNEMVFDNSVYDSSNLIRVDISTHKVTSLRLQPPASYEGLRGAFSYKESLVSFQPNPKQMNQIHNPSCFGFH